MMLCLDSLGLCYGKEAGRTERMNNGREAERTHSGLIRTVPAGLTPLALSGFPL